MPHAFFPAWIPRKFSTTFIAKIDSTLALHVVTTFVSLHPYFAERTTLVAEFLHLFVFLTLLAFSIMLNLKTFSAVRSMAGSAFAILDPKYTGTVESLASGVVGMLLQKLIVLELLQLLDSVIIQKFIDR